jgi:hypothetical protein
MRSVDRTKNFKWCIITIALNKEELHPCAFFVVLSPSFTFPFINIMGCVDIRLQSHYRDYVIAGQVPWKAIKVLGLWRELLTGLALGLDAGYRVREWWLVSEKKMCLCVAVFRFMFRKLEDEHSILSVSTCGNETWSLALQENIEWLFEIRVKSTRRICRCNMKRRW